jgi:uncharacterized protein YcbK (DUF882 family)
MSQRDLVAELRAARLSAPVEVRERVALIAARAPEPRKRFTWRRALVVAVPALAAVAAAVVLLPSNGTKEVQHGAFRATGTTPAEQNLRTLKARVAGTAGAPAGALTSPLAPQPAPHRVQQVGTELSLRAPSPAAVSSGVKRAQSIVASLGGYAVSIHATAYGKTAVADLTLKVPRRHVQTALARLSQLGTITGEQLDVQDETSGINATDREIARLQRLLRELRAQQQTDVVKRQVAAVTARIAAMQRTTAATRRAARYATVNLHLATAAAVRAVAHHGPFHRLGRAFVWAGIGLVYALALGTPLAIVLLLVWLAVRALRRRREDALLSRQ